MKALLLCNPPNPLGQFYAPEVSEAYLAFCAEYGIHLISDKVYAISIFPTNDNPEPTPFRSVLSLDYERFIKSSSLTRSLWHEQIFLC